MTREVSFRRKVIYIGIIALLLYPLFLLGQPATRDSSGGILAQMRAEYNLSQAQLGEIDPASESMKLATLGLRGVAANVLWEKSNRYKKKEDWDNFSATLNQITKLQPNFVKVWEFQAHNLAYNIAVEFDNYEHRYHWIKKGISFLTEGVHYNHDNPRLLHQTGWVTGQKIGRADEHAQYRELFREDDDFHEEMNREITIDDSLGYDGRPDNWLAGRLWFLRAQQSVDVKGMPLRGQSPLVFHKDAHMARINYASTIESEGILGEVAMRAWKRASEDWATYGRRDIPTSWGYNIRLSDLKKIEEDIQRMEKEFDAEAPGLRDRLKQEKIDGLSPEMRKTLEIPEAELTDDNYEDYLDAQTETQVTFRDAAEAVEGEKRDGLLNLAARLEEQLVTASRTRQYRQIINYEYWEIRCEAEQTRTAVNAREALYKAKQLHDDASLEPARDEYNQAWAAWRELYDAHPTLMNDVEADDLVKAIKRYGRLLQQLDEEVPEDFPLVDFLTRHQDELDEFFKQAIKDAADQDAADQDANAAPGEPADDASSEDKPAEDKPAEDKPAEDKPAEDKPAEDKPAEDKPAEDKPAEDKPAEDKPAEDKPAEDKPAEDKPAEDKPAEDKPAEDKPAEDKPAEDEPAKDAPAKDVPADDAAEGEPPEDASP